MEKKKIQRESNEHLNLFMFGFDSVSRLAAERKIPKTMNYIRNNLKGHTFKGYTMLGGSTYPNLIPVLTGKTANSSELPPLDPTTEFTDSYQVPFFKKGLEQLHGIIIHELQKIYKIMRYFRKP
jgi:hypothetical protein